MSQIKRASGGGGSGNSFTTIQVPAGTSPTADSSTDTLTLSAGTGIGISGDSATDTVTFCVNDISAFNLYDLGDVGATSPSSGCVLAWNGSSWDAAAAGGGGSPAGSNNWIQYNEASAFCANAGFQWNACSLEVWTNECCDSSVQCMIRRDGVLDYYYRAGCTCDLMKFGFFDGEVPAWGLKSNPAATGHVVNQCFLFTDYCSTWGNDGANISLDDTNNSIGLSFQCGFNISGGGGSYAIGWCSMHPNNVMINCAYYLPECAPADQNCVMRLNTMSGVLEWCSFPGGAGTPVGGQYAIQSDDGGGLFCGNQNFLYNPSTAVFCQFGLCDLGASVFPKMEICSDTLFWYFNSKDTSIDCYALGVNFQIGNGKTFEVHEFCNCDYMKYDAASGWIVLNTQNGCDLSYFGTVDRGAAIFDEDCSGITAVIAGWCNADNIRGKLKSFDSWFNFKDNEVTYLSCCNLQWKLNNGCNNGWTEVMFSGLHLGVVFDSGCTTTPMNFVQGACDRLVLGSDGFVRTCSTLDICCGLCVSGTAPAPDNTYTNPTSITIQCGIITAIS